MSGTTLPILKIMLASMARKKNSVNFDRVFHPPSDLRRNRFLVA